MINTVMAHITSQKLIITLSRLHRDSEKATSLLDETLIAQIEAIVVELAGAGVLVELQVD